MAQLMRGMARSSCHVRRPRPAVPMAWDEASSSRRRKRPRYRPPPSPVTASSPSYSPTSPSYAPTSPAYSPTEPLNWAPEEPGFEGRDDDEEEQSGSERDGSDGYDGEERDHQQAREEEETPRRQRVRDEEGESDGEQDYSDGSDGENGVEDDEQQASHLLSEEEEEEEEPLQPHGEERRRSASGREQEHPDGSDGGNGVEGEHQTGGEEEEAPPPQAHGEDDAAVAADGDLSAVATARPSSPALSIRSDSSSAVLGEMTVDRSTAGLDCGICFLPLKPPIFQCDVGHVVCSPCRDKLATEGLCHVCRNPTGFRRCHAMEQVVDAVRVPCPHAAHGCADRPAYHDRDRHASECPHAPYHCPAGADACGFAGPAPALAEHAAAAHGWACATAGASRVGVDLRDGFNFLLTAGGGAQQHLLLLNVARTPYGRAVSAAWLRPHHQAAAAAATAARCELGLYYSHYKDGLVRKHTQGSRFHVASMDDDPAAWDALKDPGASFQFLVPNRLGGSDEGDLRVTVDINIV
ncbi:unnamed protein product [Urochloa decumbens]|uniref:RING-type E3 ubiquitin transferase n=1 Tax=Urochloa decumbens TaxID=240449 RepID=A0ABC8VS09_9POAL